MPVQMIELEEMQMVQMSDDALECSFGQAYIPVTAEPATCF